MLLQVLYYTDLKLSPVKRDGLFAVSVQNLPQALSVLESRLGAFISVCVQGACKVIY